MKFRSFYQRRERIYIKDASPSPSVERLLITHAPQQTAVEE